MEKRKKKKKWNSHVFAFCHFEPTVATIGATNGTKLRHRKTSKQSNRKVTVTTTMMPNICHITHEIINDMHIIRCKTCCHRRLWLTSFVCHFVGVYSTFVRIRALLKTLQNTRLYYLRPTRQLLGCWCCHDPLHHRHRRLWANVILTRFALLFIARQKPYIL